VLGRLSSFTQADVPARAQVASSLMRSMHGTLILGLVVVAGLVGCGKHVDPDQALREGLAQQQAGNLTAAAEQYQLVLDARPNDKYANYNLGVIEQPHRPALAEGYYRKALDTDPVFAPALFNLAILRTSVGATQEAMDLYRRVIAAQPDDAAAYFNLGLLYRDAGKSELADRYTNRALGFDPSLASRLSSQPVSPGAPVGSASSPTPSAVP
jgi:tetratricopeptide (TPR) repeat protein